MTDDIETLREEAESKLPKCGACGEKLSLFIQGCCIHCKKIVIADQVIESDEEV